MSKKILISLSIIGIVSAIVIGATTAFFSDTETSSGNTFTAGSIDLKVDNHCYYNGDECACTEDNGCTWQSGPNVGKECFCTWKEKDLTDGDLFFDFADLKPGDYGEDTISLHVRDNDAWACAAIRITKNDDATNDDQDIDCTEPELEDNDTDCDANEPDNDLFDGDLAQKLYFVFWVDDGDNIYECGPGIDEILMYGYASDIIEQGGTAVYTLADSDENNVGGQDGDPLEGCQTYYIGKMWCFGDLDWDPNRDSDLWTCNGALVDNKPQTDEVQGDIIFYAVQKRNNSDFQCSSWAPQN